MKKLSITLLVLALAAFAVPAMAGDFAISGKYTFDAEDYTGQGDLKRQWYDDEFKLNVKVSQGAITAGIDLEVSDDEYFQADWKLRSTGAGNQPTSGQTTNEPGGSPYGELIENYYVKWATPVDGFAVQFGEYALNFGRKVVIFEDPAAHHISLIYTKLANVDLGLHIGKMVEAKNDDDEDTDSLGLLVNLKGVEFFKKLDFLYVKADDTAADLSAGYMGLDTAFAAGPVDLALEFGQVSNEFDEDDEGNFVYAELGFDKLAGFDINLELFQSSFEDGSLENTFGPNDFYPYMIYGFRNSANQSLTDVQLLGVSGSYQLNDKIKFMGKILAQGSAGPDDDSVGTEIDAHMLYKFADNASAQLTYATWAPGDAYYGGDGDSETDLRARFSFSF